MILLRATFNSNISRSLAHGAGYILILSVLSVSAVFATDKPKDENSGGGGGSRISDEAVYQIDPDSVPSRPRPLLELGNPFLGSGDIAPGIELPGGAVWQPSLLLFGTFRTAVQTFDDGDDVLSEWASRLDLFANLQLSGTERVLLGIRPLDEDGNFSAYNFSAGGGQDNGWQNGFSADITTLFFEGDFGELFPDLDVHDVRHLDWGFSVGRQPLTYQEGMLIDDTIDSIGVTRNTLLPRGGSDLQITFLYGWHEIDRDDNREDDGHLFGIFTALDLPISTVNADFVYVLDDQNNDDGFYWAISSVQRMGHYNTSLRVLGSEAVGDETAAVSSGHILFSEVSWTPAWTSDNVYVNAYVGLDNFASAARGPDAGGPLGRVGILFAALGLGRYAAPLGNRVDDSVGGAVGYQRFCDAAKRRQVIIELGGRQSTISNGDGEIAIGGRYQQAIGQHTVVQVDTFGALRESRDEGWGARCEIRFEF